MTETTELAAPPHLMFMVLDSLPAAFDDEIRAQLDISKLNTEIVRHTGGPYAGLELYLPSAVGLFIAAGFFNGFLQKAGEDSYDALKIAAKWAWHRCRHMRVTTTGTPGKISGDQKFTLTYSITGQVAPKLNFKFLLQSEISLEDADNGIVAFLDLINDLYNDRVDEKVIEALLSYRPVGGTVLVTYDTVQKKIVPVNAFNALPSV